jgi:hypothetical protein
MDKGIGPPADGAQDEVAAPQLFDESPSGAVWPEVGHTFQPLGERKFDCSEPRGAH